MSAAIGTIDHVVIVVAGLDESTERFRRLGFTLSPKGVHSAALGTANHTIMLQQDYFELLGVLAPTDSNSYWRRKIAAGGGIAGIALTTEDAEAAHAVWSEAGLAPRDLVRFSRQVVREGGGRMEARFEVVKLPDVAEIGVQAFVCSQPTREAVWLPELTTHANTAQAIRRLSIASPDPHAAARRWRQVGPDWCEEPIEDGVAVKTARHEIRFVTPEAAVRRSGFAATGSTEAFAIEYGVSSLAACKAALTDGGIDFQERTGLVEVTPDSPAAPRISFSG